MLDITLFGGYHYSVTLGYHITIAVITYFLLVTLLTLRTLNMSINYKIGEYKEFGVVRVHNTYIHV